MSAEKLSSTETDHRSSAPAELAPFLNPEKLSSREEFLLVVALSSYLEDPYTARFLEMERYDIHDGMTGEWDPGYEMHMDISTRNKLGYIAENGKTFLSQEYARGLVESPLARVFDPRDGHRFDLISKEDVIGSLQSLETGQTAPLSEAEDQALTLAAKEKLSRYGDTIDPELLEMYKQRILQEGDSLYDTAGKRAFAAIEEELAEQEYLSAGALENDVTFLKARFQKNFVKMQGRLWHLVYGMPEEEIKQNIEDYSFEMNAYGDMSQGEVDPEFYDKFIHQELVEYKDILSAGLLYAPVKTSTDTIGFFEESGRCVRIFRVPESLNLGDSAIPIDIEARVAELLSGATEEEIAETSQTHFLLAGNLRVRNIIEQSLGARLSDFTLDEQILLSKLLVKAAPTQMKSVVSHGPETIKRVARALEFGDDYAKTILSIVEQASRAEASKIFEATNEFRDSSAKFAGLFSDFDPSLAGATEQAMNERLTDSLYSVQQIANEGRLEVDVAPHRNSPDYKKDGRFMAKEDSLESGIYLLENTKKTPELTANILTAPDVVVSKAAEGAADSFAIYRVVSEAHGQMLVYAREYGAERYDRDFEYGNRDGVEASLSFMVDPADPHRHLSISKDPGAVSLRFDRQGFGVDEPHSIEERSPIREKGSISLDISSGMGDPKSLPVRIGRFIAAGNLLRAEKVGSAESLHHNMNGFDQEKYGSVEGFAEIPRYIKRTLEAMIAAQRDRKLGSLASRHQNKALDYPEAA